MAAEHASEPPNEQRVEREERRRARRPVVARLGNAQVPVAVPARPDVDRGAELVESRAVPATAFGLSSASNRSTVPAARAARPSLLQRKTRSAGPAPCEHAHAVILSLPLRRRVAGVERVETWLPSLRDEPPAQSSAASRVAPTRAGRDDPAPPASAREEGRSLLVALLAAGALLVGLGVAGAAGVSRSAPRATSTRCRRCPSEPNTFVYAADGSLLGVIPAERNRQLVSLEQICAWLPQATVAIEDRRFYRHGGVDAEGIARALWRDVKARDGRRGGLDDHAAARPQPLHLERAHGAAEG